MQDDRLYDEKELEKSWLISYSDLITLLFIIVVVIAAMYSSQIDKKLEEVQKAEEKQQEVLKESVQSRDMLDLKKLELQREIALFEARRDELVTQIKTIKGESAESERDMQTLKNHLSVALQELHIDFVETEEGLMVRFPEKVLFPSGSADLREDGTKAVMAVAEVLERFPHKVRIEGHTDDTPVNSGRFQSNWELSAARSIAVMRQMVEGKGIPSSRFMVAGLGEHKPLLDNTNEQSRAMNRRVEVVILAEKG